MTARLTRGGGGRLPTGFGAAVYVITWLLLPMTGETSNLLKAAWPKYDAALAAEDEIEIPVQVNGKLRGRVVVPADADENFVLECALADEKVKSALAGKQIVKRIYVPGKLVNIVVK